MATFSGSHETMNSSDESVRTVTSSTVTEDTPDLCNSFGNLRQNRAIRNT